MTTTVPAWLLGAALTLSSGVNAAAQDRPTVGVAFGGGDTLTVFVPSAPSAGAGNVVLVPRMRVRPLNVPTGDAMQLMKRRGLGLKDLVSAGQGTPGVQA